MHNRPVHFEIQAENVERAIEFYKNIFGWEFPKFMDGYWGIVTAPKESKDPGINGGLLPRKGGAPVDGQAVNAYVVTIQVDSIDDCIKKLEAVGAVCALPKMPIPGMAWQAYYKDTEGNIFGIHEADANAK